MKIISSIAVPVLCLLLISTIGAAQQNEKGFSANEWSVVLVQVASQLPQDGLILEFGFYGKIIGVSTVTNANDRGMTFYFSQNVGEWTIKSIHGYFEDSTKHQNPGMSIKEICAFLIQIESLLPQDEGIVGFEMFGKQIKVKTASVYIPLAGRGHFITFENTDGEWKKIAESTWIS